MYLSRLWRVPPAASHHKSARLEPLPPHASLAKDIAVFEIALSNLEHGSIADPTDLQPSDIGAAERCCGAAVLARMTSIGSIPRQRNFDIVTS